MSGVGPGTGGVAVVLAVVEVCLVVGGLVVELVCLAGVVVGLVDVVVCLVVGLGDVEVGE